MVDLIKQLSGQIREFKGIYDEAALEAKEVRMMGLFEEGQVLEAYNCGNIWEAYDHVAKFWFNK